MLVVEGVSRTGKTTIVRRLLERLPGYTYRHCGKAPAGVPQFRYYLWHLADAHPRMICDRLHFSDWAYGNVYRNAPSLTYHEWRLTELALLALDARVLLMSDDAVGIRSRWETGGEKLRPFDPGGIEALLERYADVAFCEECPRKTRLPVKVAHLLPSVEEPFLREIAQWVDRVEATHPPSLSLGSPRASFLVLGEATPPSEPPKDDCGADPDLPFSRGPAAAWLWRALDELGVRWWEGAYANAASFSSFNDFDDYLTQRRRLGLRRVVCLGERADRLVRDHWRRWGSATHGALDRHCVWHPSYAKRFRHREFSTWKADLGAALLPHFDAPREALESAGWPEGWDVEEAPEWLGG